MTHYTDEFKERALQLSYEIGTRRAAEQLGIPFYSLANWRRNRPKKNLSVSFDAEKRARELENEVKELRDVNKSLVDAVTALTKSRR